jgi:DNA-binding CsgD family transcriptional regulator
MELGRDDWETSGLETGCLTQRQAEVVQLLVNGKKIKEIVRHLGISKRTVDGHLSAARQRACVNTREELIGWAVWTGVAVPGRTMATAGDRTTSQRPAGPGGRPSKMTPNRIALVHELLPGHPVADVAAKIGVSRSTLYEWLRANGRQQRLVI